MTPCEAEPLLRGHGYSRIMSDATAPAPEPTDPTGGPTEAATPVDATAQWPSAPAAEAPAAEAPAAEVPAAEAPAAEAPGAGEVVPAPPGAPAPSAAPATYPAAYPTAYPAAAGGAPMAPGYPAPGYPAPGYPVPGVPAPRTSSNAIVALILAIVSWVVCPVIPAIVALVFANSADRELDASGDRLQGRGLVTAAKIVSWINIGLWAAVIVIGAFVLVIVAIAGGLSSGTPA